MNKILTVIVTYNRKNLLEESIKALLNQSYKDFDILIVDNNSTDGTYEDVVKKYIDNRVKYINTNKNIGGAGGFNLGIKEAIKSNYDYAWVMDDDSIPNENSLESIVNKSKILKGEFSYINSFVKWTDNNYCKMNGVSFDDTKILENYNLINNNLLAIESSSFVGCFINLKFAKKVGLPIKEFFIYADDMEYTLRLSNVKEAYIDMDSIIVHKMSENVTSEIHTVNENRIERYYYDFRNVTYMLIRDKKLKGFIKAIIRYFKYLLKIIKQSNSKKIKRICVITKGTISGIFFRPKIEYVVEEK